MHANISSRRSLTGTTQRLFLALWLAAIPLGLYSHGQTAQDILERTMRAMEPPIKYQLSVNGRMCTILQKKLNDKSISMRMEFGSPASLIRIETESGGFEVYPKSKSVIDIGFMGSDFSSQMSDPLGFLSGRHGPINAEELELTTDAVFEDKPCWKLSHPIRKERQSAAAVQHPAPIPDRATSVTHYYIDKQTYNLVNMETLSETGKRVLRAQTSAIEKPTEVPSELFAPPSDFDTFSPQTLVEYLGAREMLDTKRAIARLRDEASALQARSKNVLARTQATLAARRTLPRLSTNFIIAPVCMIIFVIMFSVWRQRSVINQWKAIAADPAAAQTAFANIVAGADLPYWTRLSRAPLILKAFIIYACCASLFGFAFIFSGQIDIISLSHPTIRFALPLALTFSALARFDMRNLIYGVIFLLVIHGASSVYLFQMRHSGAALLPSSQQYQIFLLPSNQQYQIFQFVMSIVMPFSWALLLMSPSMWKWLHAKSSNEDQVNQISMADLLFYTLVVALAMAAFSMFRMMT